MRAVCCVRRSAALLSGSRSARRLALIVIAALACLVAPALAQAGVIIQLPNRYPLEVNAQDEVVTDDGHLWVDGTLLSPPTAPASDPTATFRPANALEGTNHPLNDSGVVVGTVTTGSGSTVPGYWDSANSSTFTEVNLSGVTICGQPVTGGSLFGVDDAGEAVGEVTNDAAQAGGASCPGGGFRGLYVPAVGGLPAGQPQVITSVDQIPISSLEEIGPGYELAIEAPGGSAGYGGGDRVLINRLTQTATATNFAAGSGAMIDNGTMVGQPVGSTVGTPVLRLPGGSETPLTTTNTGNVFGVNDAGFSVGEDDCGPDDTVCAEGVEWSPTGTKQTLASELSANSGWTDLFPTSINAQGDIVGQGMINGKNASFLLKAGTEVSGTVSAVSCTDSGCVPSGLPGATIVVTGKADDGTAVTESDVSGDDGSWSVTVPPGSYAAGPSQDGATIDGTGFDPEQYPDQGTFTVGATPLTGKNFLVCAADAGSSTASDGVSDPLSALPGDLSGGLSAHAASSPVASLCISYYKVEVSAKIPQGMIVDPSLEAHYNTSDDPTKAVYSNSTRWITDVLRRSTYTRQLVSRPKFPECDHFTPALVQSLTKDGAHAEWYSYIKGGALGTASVTLEWNQDTGTVQVANAPTYATATLTRDYNWRMTVNGAEQSGICHEPVKVPVVMTPVLYNATGADGSINKGGFTIITTWGFPFDPAGVRLDPTPTIADVVATPIHELTAYIESHPTAKGLSELAQMAVSYAFWGKLLKILKYSPAVAKAFYNGMGKVGLIKALVGAGVAGERLHQATTFAEGLGVVGAFLGFGGESGAYPVMAAVMRGNFTTNYRKTLQGKIFTVGGVPVTTGTTLAVAVKSTRFPNIALKIYRYAYNDNSDVYTGVLPWVGPITPYASAYNPAFGRNPPYFVAVSTTTGHSYASGEDAVKNVIADTSQTPKVTESMRKFGTPANDSLFLDEEAEAKDPACVPDQPPSTAWSPMTSDTICWVFTDSRP
jgi:hypothetical protein